MQKTIYLLVICLLGLTQLQAQFEWPNPSPKRTLHQEIGDQTISIEYERPSVRGRKIFDGLVPWNKVWRTGAGFCTKLYFSHDVSIQSHKIPAGVYSLFTIPTPENWTVILNTDTTLYGSGHYQAAKDFLRFTVTPNESSRFYESLTLDLENVQNNLVFHFNWDHVHFSFLIETGIDAEVLTFINEELPQLEGEEKFRAYEMTAFYLQMTNQRLEEALEWVAKAKAGDGQDWIVILEAELLAQTGKKEQALNILEQMIEDLRSKPQANSEETAAEIQYVESKIAFINRSVE